MRVVGTSLIAAVALVASTAAFAYGAKPTAPSGFGELVRDSVPLGDLASTDARNDDGPGVSFEVQKGRGEEGSTPHLPPSHP